MGMAHLMGQLALPANPEVAVPLLHRAATLASVDVPQPAYVYGLLLLSEFKHVSIPQPLFTPYIPPNSSTQIEARKHVERAAYLNFAPAQYKLGHAYEFALPPFPYDALLSVQYYSLASQQGEVEADMALSKWFLCGAEGSFEKDEALAFTFSEKAARKGLASAEFAMGYYKEVGIGCTIDVESSKKWYQKVRSSANIIRFEEVLTMVFSPRLLLTATTMPSSGCRPSAQHYRSSCRAYNTKPSPTTNSSAHVHRRSSAPTQLAADHCLLRGHRHRRSCRTS